VKGIRSLKTVENAYIFHFCRVWSKNFKWFNNFQNHIGPKITQNSIGYFFTAFLIMNQKDYFKDQIQMKYHVRTPPSIRKPAHTETAKYFFKISIALQQNIEIFLSKNYSTKNLPYLTKN